MKLIIAFISIAVALTSIVGCISMIMIVGNAEDNFQINQNDMEFGFGSAGNNISMSFNFTNEGYFDFEDFAVSVSIKMENKTSNYELYYLNSTVFEDDLEAKQMHQIDIFANASLFDNQSLLDDMGGSFNDPEIDQLLIDYPGLLDETIVAPLSFPYILDSYDIAITFSISSTYNLGLIDFGLEIEYDILYEDYFSTSYDQMKQDLKDHYGL